MGNPNLGVRFRQGSSLNSFKNTPPRTDTSFSLGYIDIHCLSSDASCPLHRPTCEKQQ
ncbi:hypothetical protein C8Q78DRAFT_1016356 [Trametes maxima]|nr:hypothetical protein C8Q78DRAFT_1016356 [Trametes maxima]